MRPRWVRRGISCGAFLTAVALVSPGVAQPSPPKPASSGPTASQPPGAGGATPAATKTPAEIFKEARDAYKKGDYEAALKGFQEVWAVEKRAKVVGNLGRTELKLKRYRDAAEHLDQFLRSESGMEKDERAAVFAELTEAKSHVTTLRIVASPVGAEVYIDGVNVGTAPLAHDYFVDPGPHKIEARHKGGTDVKEIDTKAGAEWPVKLEVPEKKEEVKPPPPPPPAPFPTRIVILSAGAGVAVIGGVLMGVAVGQKSSALARVPTDVTGIPLCSMNGNDRGGAAECDDIRSTASSADAIWGVGVGLLVVGGTAAVGAAASWLLPGSGKASGKATSRVVPVVGAEGAGVVWQGSF